MGSITSPSHAALIDALQRATLRCLRYGALPLVLLSGMLFAQTQVTPSTVDPAAESDTHASQQTNDQQPEDSQTVLKVNVHEVPVYFVVHDKHGGLVPDLPKDDFQVYDNGKLQTIKTFRKDTDRPLTLGLMVDTSPSQTRVLGDEKEAGAEFIRQVLTPKDEAFLISFSQEVSLDQDTTSDKQALIRTLDKEKIVCPQAANAGIPGVGQGPLPQSGRGGCTLLFDAVYLATTEKLKNEAGRKALIFLTDGGDQGSKMRLRDAIEAAQKTDTICYVILISDSGQGNAGDMRHLAEETGGRMINVGNNYEKLKKAFDQIGQELRTQYELSYTPTDEKTDGSFHKIDIKTKSSDNKVQARKGYYAPEE